LGEIASIGEDDGGLGTVTPGGPWADRQSCQFLCTQSTVKIQRSYCRPTWNNDRVTIYVKCNNLFVTKIVNGDFTF